MFVYGKPLAFSMIFKDYNKSSAIGILKIPGIYKSFYYLFRNIFVFYLLAYFCEKTLTSNRGAEFHFLDWFKSIFKTKKKPNE